MASEKPAKHDDTALACAYHMSEYPGMNISISEALHSAELRAALELRVQMMHRQRTIAAARCHSWFDHSIERDHAHRASMHEIRTAAQGAMQ